MKSFLISLAFLAAFIAATVINCLYVTNVLGNVSEALDKLPYIQSKTVPSDISEKTDSLCGYWDKHFRLMSLSINISELRDCGISLGNLAQFSDSDTSADYNAALSEARRRLRVLYDRERLSIENIL